MEEEFEKSKARRLISKHKLEAAKGAYHMKMVARREAGAKLTIEDMRAEQAVALDTDPEVKGAYLAFIEADSNYRAAKVKFEAAKRDYWDQKPQR